MKRAIFVGVVAFLLGSTATPRASNKDETVALLCKRFRENGASTLGNSRRFLEEARATNNMYPAPVDKYRFEHSQWAMHEAVKDSLSAIERTLCY
jgi:hypothetical protein